MFGRFWTIVLLPIVSSNAQLWSWISGPSSNTIATSPSDRYSPTLWNHHQGNIFLYGGYGVDGPLNDLWTFNNTDYSWSFIETVSRPAARKDAATCIQGSSLYMFGGSNGKLFKIDLSFL